MIEYVTQANDMLDAICFKYYGSSEDYTEAVRDANPLLAEYGPILPSGIRLLLPDFESITIQQQTIRLWD